MLHRLRTTECFDGEAAHGTEVITQATHARLRGEVGAHDRKQSDAFGAGYAGLAGGRGEQDGDVVLGTHQRGTLRRAAEALNQSRAIAIRFRQRERTETAATSGLLGSEFECGDELGDRGIARERFDRDDLFEPAAKQMRERLQGAGAEIGPHITVAFNGAGTEQHDRRLQPGMVQSQRFVAPDMVEHEAARGAAVAVEEVGEDRALLRDRREHRRLVGLGVVDEQFVVPEQHRAVQSTAAEADALEQFAVLLAAEFEPSDQTGHGLRPVEQRARGGRVVASARRMLPNLALLRELLQHPKGRGVRDPEQLTKLARRGQRLVGRCVRHHLADPTGEIGRRSLWSGRRSSAELGGCHGQPRMRSPCATQA